MKFLTHDGTLYFWKKIKSYVDTIVSTHVQTVATGGTGATNAIDARTNLGLGIAATKAVDTTPTASSTNLITSGGVKTALDGKAASSHTHSYLPLTGGSLSSDLTVNDGSVITKNNTYGFTSTISGGSVNLCNNTLSLTPGSTTIAGSIKNSGETTGGTVLHTGNSAMVKTTTTDPGAGVSSSYSNGTIILVYE